MAEISEAIAMIKKAETDAEQLVLDSKIKSTDMINESRVNAVGIVNAVKGSAEEEVQNTIFDAEKKAKKEAEVIAADAEKYVNALKEKAMANVDEAAFIIVKNIL